MMWRAALIAICLICSSCSVRQPERIRTVSAFQIPLPSAAERSEFLTMLREDAAAEGLHVDAGTDEELRAGAQADPHFAMTVHAAVWRGSEDRSSEAVIMDQYDHLGQVWIMFSKGEDPALAARFRERAMRRIVARWPDTRSLPIMPTGTIPLYDDLELTPNGYLVKPDATGDYGLAPGSPLFAPRKKPAAG